MASGSGSGSGGLGINIELGTPSMSAAGTHSNVTTPGSPPTEPHQSGGENGAVAPHSVAFHFEETPQNAPAPVPAVAVAGSGGGEEDFLARFRQADAATEVKVDVKAARTIDPETMARLNARAGIYSGGYEQLLALRAKPVKGEATMRDIKALEELHANTIRRREGKEAKGPVESLDQLMIGGGIQLKSIIQDGAEVSINEMGRIMADHKEATDTMRARMAAAKKAGIPDFRPPPPTLLNLLSRSILVHLHLKRKWFSPK